MNACTRQRLKAAALLILGIAPAEFNWAYLPRLASHPALFWLVDGFRWLLLPAIIFFIAIRLRVFTPGDVGLHTRLRGKLHPIGFIAAMIVVPYAMCQMDAYNIDHALTLTDSLDFPATFDYTQMLPAHPGHWRFALALYLALTAGFVEEFYYRGLFRHVIGRGSFRTGLFIVLSTLVFLPPHLYGGAADVYHAALFGAEAAIIYALLGNLWPLILGHLLIDLGIFS